MQKEDILRAELEKRILLLDGGMGSLIQTFKLTEEDFRGSQYASHPTSLKGNNDLLSVTKPEVIAAIHRWYLEAGSDIIETNTFNSNSISMEDYGLEAEVERMNKASVQIARQLADEFTAADPSKPRFVCGTMGPLSKTLSLSPDVNDPGFRAVSFDQVRSAYYQQAEVLLSSGADILMVETVFDTLNAKAALVAIADLFADTGKSLPVMVSGTITDASGRTLSGQTLEAFLISISHFPLLSVGINCALGAEEMRPHIEYLARKCPFYVSAHPNAGLPNQFGEYDQLPEDMAQLVSGFLSNSWVNIIGGCCGSTHKHIEAIAKLAKKASPRIKPQIAPVTALAGLDPLRIEKISNFVNIGERANVAGSRKFARLIREKKYEEAISIVRDQVEGGAQAIDVNLDDGMLDALHEMEVFLKLLVSEPDIARLPVMVDSSKFEVLITGLKCLQGKAIVNSISLKEGEEKFIEQAKEIKKYGAAAVVMAFDEKGQADSLERRIEICSKSYKILVDKAGFAPHDIIFDPNVLTVATGMEEHSRYALDFIEATRWIKQNLPHAKVSGGISNVSFSFRGNDTVREAMHSVFLYYAIEAGLDMGIVNPSMLQVYSEIPPDLLKLVEDVILCREADSTEKLIAYAETVKGTGAQEKRIDAWRSLTLEERISHALVKGIHDYLEEDMAQAVQKYSPTLSIIEGPLMAGMNLVGELFGAGKMFLPQVVKTARVMKKAVAILLPRIEAEKADGASSSAGKILMATVKGDVHDIGKNIVGVVLACNNYEIIDLGVMVPCETILEQAAANNVDAIGLSGLITPSLDEMVGVAKAMQARGMKIPLMIGGATTSKVHTAVKIAPEYSGCVAYALDASQSVGVASSLLSKERGPAFAEKLRKEYSDIAEKHKSAKPKTLLTLQQARERKLDLGWSNFQPCTPKIQGTKILLGYPLAEIAEYIDWTFFFHAWDMPGVYPKILSHPEKGREATSLFADAQKMLAEIIEGSWLQANAAIGIFSAYSTAGDSIVLLDQQGSVLTSLPQLRQQADAEHCLSLADFIAPQSSGKTDYLGLFALTAGIGCQERATAFEQAGDDYSAIMIKALADRLAEAFAELLHHKVRTEYWAYAPDENTSKEDMRKGRFQGIRPALGYPACPEHSVKELMFSLLQADTKAGISLTDSFAMLPAASVSGMYFAHPESKYFGLGRIAKDQAEAYCAARGISLQQLEKTISPNIGY
jgi:5-methyltetrahydrofolate--homocysteine methyltransferase